MPDGSGRSSKLGFCSSRGVCRGVPNLHDPLGPTNPVRCFLNARARRREGVAINCCVSFLGLSCGSLTARRTALRAASAGAASRRFGGRRFALKRPGAQESGSSSILQNSSSSRIRKRSLGSSGLQVQEAMDLGFQQSVSLEI